MREQTYSHSPTLTLDRNVLRYDDVWSLRLDDISLIGEYTTTAGPVDQDYFIVFIDSNGTSYDAPAVTLEGYVEDELRKRFRPLTLQLVGSTAERSRIAWPPSVADAELYTYTPQPARTWTERVLRLFGTRNVNIDLSPAAASIVDGVNQDHDCPPIAAAASDGYGRVGALAPAKVHHLPVGAATASQRHR